MSQPITLLVISASTGGTIMFLYSMLLIALNKKMLPAAIRINSFRTATLVWSTLLFGSLAMYTIYDQMSTATMMRSTVTEHESTLTFRI